jgi:pimeloyl-ACP methyl ester carboxylesterase
MSEEVRLRIHGRDTAPTLVYLPGLHGDWTLIASFYAAMDGHAQFIEVTYPRTLTWSLDEYAVGIESALAANGVTSGWLLAESFGSQVGWQIAGRGRFRAQGLILAGGFVRHPAGWEVRLAERLAGAIPTRLLAPLLHLYAGVARVRYRSAPEVLLNLQEFIGRRTDLDRLAVLHRLKLIIQNDPGSLARCSTLPVYALTGLFDAVVPWWPVRRWLKRNCSALREHRIVWCADHPVLVTAPKAAAKQVLNWILPQRPRQTDETKGKIQKLKPAV